VPREDDQIEFPQQIRWQPLLDDPVDQRLDVRGVRRADETVAGV